MYSPSSIHFLDQKIAKGVFTFGSIKALGIPPNDSFSFKFNKLTWHICKFSARLMIARNRFKK